VYIRRAVGQTLCQLGSAAALLVETKICLKAHRCSAVVGVALEYEDDIVTQCYLYCLFCCILLHYPWLCVCAIIIVLLPVGGAVVVCSVQC
jgi:hypothetical protein